VPDRRAITPQDVAEYILDMSRELAELARGAGLQRLASSLERARRTADADMRALHSAAGNAAPEDAA
jgi:glutamate synthase domain-containing protein 2